MTPCVDSTPLREGTTTWCTPNYDRPVMRRLVVIDLFEGPAWRDASDMIEHPEPGPADDVWLMIQPRSVRVVGDWADGEQVLRDAEHGGPSFYCRAWHTAAGRDRPTVYTVDAGDADLHEEVLTGVGFRFDQPEGIELRRDESGIYRGYYV
jgi:hypothetical protein